LFLNGGHLSRMNVDTDQSAHRWPEEELPAPAPTPKTGWLARIGRALGDVFLTAGMARGLASPRGGGEERAISNVMLFGEGEAKGRESAQGSGPDLRR
jgi:hypothetical protein